LDEAGITRYIAMTFFGVDVVVASKENGAPEIAWGDTFFIYDPDRNLDDTRRFPFATIVTKDYGDFDNASRLDRPGVFRLNIGVSKETFAKHAAGSAHAAPGVRAQPLCVRAEPRCLDISSHRTSAERGVRDSGGARCEERPPGKPEVVDPLLAEDARREG
jgi:hypothetical protein